MLHSAFKGLLGAGFVLAGCLHFVYPGNYAKIIPPIFPAPLALVYISGVCELVLGGLIFTRYSPWAAWGLIALLVAVFPANVYMALRPELFPKVPPALLWWRLPFQAVFIAWAYRYTS